MTQYIDKSALVAEIEKELNTTKKYSTEYVNGKKYALKKILSFLDTLEVKEVNEEPISNDIEAEFVLYLKHKFNIPQEGSTLKTDRWSPSPYDLLDIAKHFAQWQKEQLMENAVEAVIHPYDGEIWVDKDLLSIYDDCQRVKLIIIKEK